MCDLTPDLPKDATTQHVPFVSAFSLLWRRKWQPIPVSLPGESHEQRSLAGSSPQGRKESGTTERFSLTYSLSILTVLSFILCLFCPSSSVL